MNSLSPEKFYEQLPSFKNFSEFTKSEHGHLLPSDWWIIIADIRGSTKAIEEGRYRDVNLLGASVITAVLNANKKLKIPYVFGGDGATLAVPAEALDACRRGLSALQSQSEDFFRLELRVGFVPVKDIPTKIFVSKYEYAPQCFLAMFGGGGLSLAEKWVKSGSSKVTLLEARKNTSGDSNLDGLSCRWQPLNSRNGLFLSVIIKARMEGIEALRTYEDVIQKLQTNFRSELKDLSPVHLENIQVKSPSFDFKNEGAIWMTKWPAPIRALLAFLKSVFIYFVFKLNIPLGPFRPEKYRREIPQRADYKKFEDALKFVIDCTVTQVSETKKLLQKWREEGLIYYGLHTSEQAVMTCLVFSASEGQHVHFIDGARGGYAMAAKQLKEQLV